MDRLLSFQAAHSLMLLTTSLNPAQLIATALVGIARDYPALMGPMEEAERVWSRPLNALCVPLVFIAWGEPLLGNARLATYASAALILQLQMWKRRPMLLCALLGTFVPGARRIRLDVPMALFEPCTVAAHKMTAVNALLATSAPQATQCPLNALLGIIAPTLARCRPAPLVLTTRQRAPSLGLPAKHARLEPPANLKACPIRSNTHARLAATAQQAVFCPWNAQEAPIGRLDRARGLKTAPRAPSDTTALWGPRGLPCVPVATTAPPLPRSQQAAQEGTCAHQGPEALPLVLQATIARKARSKAFAASWAPIALLALLSLARVPRVTAGWWNWKEQQTLRHHFQP